MYKQKTEQASAELEHKDSHLRTLFITLDKALFQPKKSDIFSYFSMKTYFVVLIRSASLRHF